nr:RNA polymerase sigma factor [Ktedonobacterales bacterium]
STPTASTPTASTPAAASGRAAPARTAEFERFFREHEARVSSYLWRMTSDTQTTSDLSQETFLRAWQHFDTIRGYDNPGAWLLRVGTNLALRHFQRRKGPVGAASSLSNDEEPGASDPGHRFAERDLVRETLLELPPRSRALLVLREVYGLTGPEVAEALGMSHDAVKVGLWRARARFRAAYVRKDERP